MLELPQLPKLKSGLTPQQFAVAYNGASNSRSKVGGFSHWSPILLYGDIKMPVDFKSWHAIANAYPQGFGHPSPKPECVMEWLVGACAEENETILDPFMGSGTTGVACVRLGRRFIGIERERKYFDLAVSRIKAEFERTPLFDPKPTQRMFEEKE
jgi:DNA modification methylase